MEALRRVRIFKNGRSQAIRIPRELELDAAEATIRKEGNRSVGANGLLIGAHALKERCVLVTHNGSEFVHIAGLKIEDWLAD
jgi:predicted nucleic acid-binding protein